MFWARLSHFSPFRQANVVMTLRRAQKHNYASEHKLFYYHLHFWRVLRKQKPKKWGNIVFWPSPPPPLHRTNMASQKASLQAKNGRALQDIERKGYTWESPRKKNSGMQTSTVHCADESI